MGNDGAVGSLMFFTLITVLVVVAIALVLFLRKRRNRHPMDGIQERNIDEIRHGDPPHRE